MAQFNLDVYDLSSVDLDGVINEDVMQTIFEIDPVDLPFHDMAGRETSDNAYKSWIKDSLEAPSLANAQVDGADLTASPPVASGDETVANMARVGNHHQISTKVVKVSTRAQKVDTIGYANALVYQLRQRQQELRRQCEATACSPQASVEATDLVAGKTAGAAAMFETNIINGTAGGFSAGIYSGPTPGAARAMTETDVRDAGEMAYNEGGNPTKLMSVPKMIRKLSEYLFTSSARIGTIQTNVSRNSVSEGEYGHQGVTAVGAVNVIVTDFQTLEFVPNRSQLLYDNGGTDCCDVFIMDPEYWAITYIQGIETEALAKTGLSSKRMMSVDWSIIAKQEKASAIIMGIDPTLAVTA
jgi:hypothetical protein